MEEDYPCDDCYMEDSCDSWNRQFCCSLCRYYTNDDPPCDECDPMDI